MEPPYCFFSKVYTHFIFQQFASALFFLCQHLLSLAVLMIVFSQRWGDILLWLFQFSHDEWCWTCFHVPIGNFSVSFWEMSVLSTACLKTGLFGMSLMNYWSFLCNLIINLLLDIYFANIFSHSVVGKHFNCQLDTI